MENSKIIYYLVSFRGREVYLRSQFAIRQLCDRISRHFAAGKLENTITYFN